MVKYIKYLLVFSAFIIFPACVFAVGDVMDASDDSQWNQLETGYLTVYYVPGADLESIEKSLKRRVTYFDSDIPGEGAPPEEQIRFQLDALFRHAQDILDMHPPRIHVKIRIFRYRSDLASEYARIFESSEPSDEDVKAFYVHKYNTIYTSEEDISDSVIAHEMGHAIVDNYFAVIPPEKVRELLASYVDMHLSE